MHVRVQDTPPTPSSQRPQPPQTFEFTKRKKWAEILIAEVPDTIMLVLSAACKIWFCGAAMTELLGWDVDDMIDSDFLHLVNDDDQHTFNECFRNVLHAKQELLIYARLKSKRDCIVNADDVTTYKELLFEIKARPYVLPGEMECKCFFATAQPYPSRNMAFLNTFLELKMENERLKQRLGDLRSQQVSVTCIGSSTTPPSLPIVMSVPSNYSNTPYSAMVDTGSTRSALDAVNVGNYTSAYNGNGNGSFPSIDAEEEGVRKRKFKKLHPSEVQYVCVTCGRTDSPEWRKGPLGPKTLCNACGLRYAKKARKNDDPPIKTESQISGASSGGSNDSDGASGTESAGASSSIQSCTTVTDYTSGGF